MTYEPDRRPGVANLLTLASLCTGAQPEIAEATLDDVRELMGTSYR